MKMLKIKQSNIAIVFERLDHSVLSPEELKKMLDYSKDEALSVIEAPGLKLFLLPNKKKAIVFEQNRLRINDDSGNEVDKSEVLDILQKMISKFNTAKILAIGFNYAVMAEIDSRKLVQNLYSGVFKNHQSIQLLKGGFRLGYEKDKHRFDLVLSPTELENQILITLNSHYDSIPSDLSTKFSSDFKEIERIIKGLK